MEIKLQGAKNVRDLCDIPLSNGRKIKKGRIIRSSNLSSITDSDIEALLCYNIKKIVDFRTEAEIKEAPDKEIFGAEWLFNPILKALTIGTTRKDNYKRELSEIFLDFTIELGETAPEWLAELYVPLVSDNFSLGYYKKFLDTLKSNKSGAVLYHCSAGKDRVGVGTMLVLLILGAEFEAILEDYLITNQSYRSIIDEAILLGRERGINEEIIKVIGAVNGVDASYLKRAYDIILSSGGIEKFLLDKLGIDDCYIREFRENYLE